MSVTSLTGWPVTEATVRKSRSSHKAMRPARSAVLRVLGCSQ